MWQRRRLRVWPWQAWARSNRKRCNMQQVIAFQMATSHMIQSGPVGRDDLCQFWRRQAMAFPELSSLSLSDWIEFMIIGSKCMQHLITHPTITPTNRACINIDSYIDLASHDSDQSRPTSLQKQWPKRKAPKKGSKERPKEREPQKGDHIHWWSINEFIDGPSMIFNDIHWWSINDIHQWIHWWTSNNEYQWISNSVFEKTMKKQ